MHLGYATLISNDYRALPDSWEDLVSTSQAIVNFFIDIDQVFMSIYTQGTFEVDTVNLDDGFVDVLHEYIEGTEKLQGF